jgi:hypothetical protein
MYLEMIASPCEPKVTFDSVQVRSTIRPWETILLYPVDLPSLWTGTMKKSLPWALMSIKVQEALREVILDAFVSTTIDDATC